MNDPRYFQSYASSGIHEDMLKDTVRTKAYMHAMTSNKSLFHKKIVMDVGCGTGILSMFAADAGAKHVYAVDCSNVIDIATKIVDLNNYGSKITLIKSRVEDVILPVPTVDIIVSEWMGYCLLYESMLESVLFARDKWLAPKGMLFPDVANLFMCGIEDEEFREQKVDWWKNVWGYNMSPMMEVAISEPIVDNVDKAAMVTSEVLIKRFDLYTVPVEDIRRVEANVWLQCKRQDYMHAFILFFSVQFTQCHKTVEISTSPVARPTHWKQAIFYLPQSIPVYFKQKIPFKIIIDQNKENMRCLNIEIHQYDGDSHENVAQSRTYNFS